MRRLLILACLCSASLFACNSEDPAPLYMEANYQLRCIDCKPTAVDEQAHDLTVLNGEGGYTVGCSALQVSGDHILSFSVGYIDPTGTADGFSLEVSQANIDASNPGSDCRVKVHEASNEYLAQCTGDGPTASKPCKLDFSIVDTNVVTGTIDCNTIPNRSDAQLRRYLVKVNSQKPATFRIEGCTGL